MYSSEDFERLFIRYKCEAYPRGESIQAFCHRNNVPYNLFEKWYKDTRHKVVEVEVSGRPSPQETEKSKVTVPQQKEEVLPKVRILVDLRMSNGLHLRQGNLSYSDLKRSGRETGGAMLSISELGSFYYLCNFHDMRCKYARVLSVIRQQMDRELRAGEVYIMMSKDRQTVLRPIRMRKRILTARRNPCLPALTWILTWRLRIWILPASPRHRVRKAGSTVWG